MAEKLMANEWTKIGVTVFVVLITGAVLGYEVFFSKERDIQIIGPAMGLLYTVYTYLMKQQDDGETSDD